MNFSDNETFESLKKGNRQQILQQSAQEYNRM